MKTLIPAHCKMFWTLAHHDEKNLGIYIVSGKWTWDQSPTGWMDQIQKYTGE